MFEKFNTSWRAQFKADMALYDTLYKEQYPNPPLAHPALVANARMLVLESGYRTAHIMVSSDLLRLFDPAKMSKPYHEASFQERKAAMIGKSVFESNGKIQVAVGNDTEEWDEYLHAFCNDAGEVVFLFRRLGLWPATGL
jgi:hypothetical protein